MPAGVLLLPSVLTGFTAWPGRHEMPLRTCRAWARHRQPCRLPAGPPLSSLR